MRRDTSNPDRVVPDPHGWRTRRADGPVFGSLSAVRYAREQITERNRRECDEPGERVWLSSAAERLYRNLCNIAARRGSTGRIDLTYGQLQSELGVPQVGLVDEHGHQVLDEFGEPVSVADPGWGEGVSALQRQLRELQAAGFVSIGYVSNGECGGHRLCVTVGGPSWFVDAVNAVVAQARAKGGRRSRPSAGSPADHPVARAVRPVHTDCAACDGTGWVETPSGAMRRCDLDPASRSRAGP